MARARNIKPAIMNNEALAELPPLTRLLFIYLWMLADREGRLEDRPKRIGAQALPYERTADIEAMLNGLQRTGFIIRYAAGAQACIQIVNFGKHQAPHVREMASALPPCMPGQEREAAADTAKVAESQSQREEKARHNLGSAQASPRSPDSLIPDSLIPDSLNVDTGLPGRPAPAPHRDTGPAPAPKPAQAPATGATVHKLPSRTPRKTTIPRDFGISERVRGWASERGIGQLDEHLDAFRRKATAKGYTYASWDDAFIEAVREDWAKLRPPRHASGYAQRIASEPLWRTEQRALIQQIVPRIAAQMPQPWSPTTDPIHIIDQEAPYANALRVG